MHSLEYNLYREVGKNEDDLLIPVSVEFDYSPPCKGTRENGVPMEPDSPEEVEICSVKDGSGIEITLSPSEEEDLMEACLKKYHGIEEDAIIARAEAQEESHES